MLGSTSTAMEFDRFPQITRTGTAISAKIRLLWRKWRKSIAVIAICLLGPCEFSLKTSELIQPISTWTRALTNSDSTGSMAPVSMLRGSSKSSEKTHFPLVFSAWSPQSTAFLAQVTHARRNSTQNAPEGMVSTWKSKSSWPASLSTQFISFATSMRWRSWTWWDQTKPWISTSSRRWARSSTKLTRSEEETRSPRTMTKSWKPWIASSFYTSKITCQEWTQDTGNPAKRRSRKFPKKRKTWASESKSSRKKTRMERSSSLIWAQQRLFLILFQY